MWTISPVDATVMLVRARQRRLLRAGLWLYGSELQPVHGGLRASTAQRVRVPFFSQRETLTSTSRTFTEAALRRFAGRAPYGRCSPAGSDCDNTFCQSAAFGSCLIACMPTAGIADWTTRSEATADKPA